MCAVSRMVPGEVELVGRAGARELAQAAQRQLDVARAELDLVVEVLELALVPHLHGAEVPALVLADAHAFRIVAVGAERRGAGGADPLVAALVAPLLLGEALGERLQELLEPAHRLDLLLLLFGQILLGELLEPFDRDLDREPLLQQFEPLEHVAEHAVELVEVALVLHQHGAREVIEILHAPAREIGVHRLHQGQVFAQRHRHAGGFELMEEGDEHRATIRRNAAAVKPGAASARDARRARAGP